MHPDRTPRLESMQGHFLAAVTAALVGCSLAYWHGGSTCRLAHQATLFALLAVLARDNARTGLLRDTLALPGMALGVALTCLCSTVDAGAPGLGLAIAGIGIAVAALLTHAALWTMSRFWGRQAFGLGDVKCLIMVGAFFGTSQWLVGFVVWMTILALLLVVARQIRSMPSGYVHLTAALVAALVGPFAQGEWPAVLGG